MYEWNSLEVVNNKAELFLRQNCIEMLKHMFGCPKGAPESFIFVCFDNTIAYYLIVIPFTILKKWSTFVLTRTRNFLYNND